MAPKSKKAVQEKKKQTIEDKTFGLKNKNKSKKVQQFVNRVEKQAEYTASGSKSGKDKSAADAEKKATSKKALMAARLAEMELLGKPVEKKGLSEEQKRQEEKRRKAEEEEAERLRILSLPVEEQIEIERAKLTTKTPVTLELFLEWRKQKKLEKEMAEKKATEERMKGLSRAERARGQGMSGRALFAYNADVFVDDEGADETLYAVPEDYRSDDEEATDPDATGKNEAEALEGRVADLSVAASGEEKGEGTGVGDESLFS